MGMQEERDGYQNDGWMVYAFKTDTGYDFKI